MKKKKWCAYAFMFLSLTGMSLCAFGQQKPMMGWSTWNTFRININEKLIEASVDSMIKHGLRDVGYTYVNIDDGWFGGGRNTDKTVKINSTKFPNGMKVIADYCHDKGMKAGIYSDAGCNTCASIWDGDDLGIGVGMWGYDDVDCKTFFKDWGYDYIKVDWCGGDATGKTPQERYTAIRQAMDNTGRSDLRLNICRWEFPGTWASEIGGSWRISTDISPNWTNMIKQFNSNLYMAAYAGPGHFNDMDMCEIGNPKTSLTLNEEKAHFALWCIMKSPLMMGCDLRSVKKQTLDIYKNTELIALNQDDLGEQARVIWRKGDLFVLACNLETIDGTKRGICLFNRGTTKAKIRVNFADLSLGGKVTLRDLYKHEDLGEFENYYEADVEGHSVIALKAVGEKRSDKNVFEGEYAYMNDYLPNLNLDKARFSSCDNASGEYIMSKLGNSVTNWAEFRNIYSTKGGNSTLKIYYLCADNRNMTVSVNGKEQILENLSSGGESNIASIELPVELKAGMNTIRLSNATGWAPNIDKIEISPITISPSDAAVCLGDEATLTASGAETYEWKDEEGIILSSSETLHVTPTRTTHYRIEATFSDGTTYIGTHTVRVKEPNQLHLNYDQVSICTSSSVTLEASGASLYKWSPADGLSSTSGKSVVAKPLKTTIYTVVGSEGELTCGADVTKTVKVIVNEKPELIVSPSDANINGGEAAEFTFSGANNYFITPTSSVQTTNLSRQGWTVTASSQQSPDVPSNILDGNASTIWQSSWPSYAPWPHTATIDMKAIKQFSGIRLTPRQNSKYGRTNEYKIWASADGTDYTIIAEGSLVKVTGYADGNNSSDLIIHFPETSARYIRFESYNNVTGTTTDLVTSLAEFNVFTSLKFTPTTSTVYTVYGNNGCEESLDFKVTVDNVIVPTPNDGYSYTISGMRGPTSTATYLTALADNSGIKSKELTSPVEDDQKWVLETNKNGFALKNVKYGTYLNSSASNDSKVTLLKTLPSVALQLVESTTSGAPSGSYWVKNVGSTTSFLLHSSDNWDNRGWVMWNYTRGTFDSFLFNRLEKVPVLVENVSNPKLKVTVENGYIKVSGSNEIPSIYSLLGTEINNQEKLQTGVYFVKVGQDVCKVIVP